MGYRIGLGQFNTDGTDHIEVQSGFNLTGGNWGGNQLTNIPSTTLYQNTFDITSPAPGSVVEYKFHIWGTRDVWESLYYYPDGNRRFTLASSAQSVPSAFFSDTWAASGPGIAVTFQIDMSAQVGAGYFNPGGGDLIQAMGAFNNSWNGFALTNDPNASNTNLYTGTYTETARPPGTRIEYKFAVNVGGGGTLNYESIAGYPDNNRSFMLATVSPELLPSVFFSDTSGFPIKAGVYFQLDLSSQILTKAFNPAQDIASVRGAAMGWDNPPGSGLQLFVDSARPGIYTNTYLTASQLTGAAFEYKNTFYQTATANTVWENGGNLSVTFIGNEPTNSAGYHMITVGPDLFDNFLADTNDYLPADTLVTFILSMTNAQSYPGFSPQITFNQTMGVAINGDWLGWYSWTAAAPVADYLTNGTSGDLIYSQTLLIPQGNSLQLTYKYGIDDGTDSLDNEAGFATNHVRFIRKVGSYTMPMDTFGTAVTEPLMANLTVGPPVAGHVLVSWLGNPGVHLQTAASIVGATWQDHLDTASYSSPSGIYSTNYPMSAGPTFFRLVKP
jgi:hypothetical protein